MAHTSITSISQSAQHYGATPSCTFHLTSSHASSLIPYTLSETGSTFSGLKDVDDGNLERGARAGSWWRQTLVADTSVQRELRIVADADGLGTPGFAATQYLANTGSFMEYKSKLHNKLYKLFLNGVYQRTSSFTALETGTNNQRWRVTQHSDDDVAEHLAASFVGTNWLTTVNNNSTSRRYSK